MKQSHVGRASLQIHRVTVTTSKIPPSSSRYRRGQGLSRTPARASRDPARGGVGGLAGMAVSGSAVGFGDSSCRRSSDRTAVSHPVPCPPSKAWCHPLRSTLVQCQGRQVPACLGDSVRLCPCQLRQLAPRDTPPVRKGTRRGARCGRGAAEHGHPALPCCLQTPCLMPLEIPAAGTAHGRNQRQDHLSTGPSGLSEPPGRGRPTLPTSPTALFLVLSLLQAFALKPSEEPQDCTTAV